MVRIETERLVIREIVREDFDRVHAFESRPELFYHAPRDARSIDDTNRLIDRMIATQLENPRLIYSLVVCLKTMPAVIGRGSIRIASVDQGDASVGYVIHPAHWGKGYATETVRALLDFGFDVLDLYRISASGDPENIGSIRVMEKVGMKFEKLIKEELDLGNRKRDTVIYAISKRNKNE
jgi:ribosomal-protein-alanine N-acetyltransferase